MDMPASSSHRPMGSNSVNFRHRLNRDEASLNLNKHTSGSAALQLQSSSIPPPPTSRSRERKTRAATSNVQIHCGLSLPPSKTTKVKRKKRATTCGTTPSSLGLISEDLRDETTSAQFWTKHRGSPLDVDPVIIERTSSSSFGSSEINFEDLFAELKRYEEEHDGNLSLPIAHPTFESILDICLSFGMEDLLKNRWDSQFAGLKVFKRDHDDCLVPPCHPKLGTWSRVQCDHYKLFRERLPSPLTKQRFDYLNDVGFDEFVRWEENAKNAKEAGSAETAAAVAMGGSNEAVISGDLTLDEKIAMRQINNKIKFTSENNGKKSMSLLSSSSNKAKPGREAVVAEMTQKRMLRRSVRVGLGRSLSRKLLLAESMEEECDNNNDDDNININEDDKAKSSMTKEGGGLKSGLRSSGVLEKYAHMVRSCSASNLCPGSWECSHCTYINEPAGLDCPSSRDVCKVCEQPNSNPPSPRHGDAPPIARRGFARDKSMTRDDFTVDHHSFDTSWRDLDGALESAVRRSMAEMVFPDQTITTGERRSVLRKNDINQFRSKRVTMHHFGKY